MSRHRWIAGAIRHPGALRRERGIPVRRTIPLGLLVAAARSGGKLGRRARLALRLCSFRGRRR
jgi:hypothetical protein